MKLIFLELFADLLLKFSATCLAPSLPGKMAVPHSLAFSTPAGVGSFLKSRAGNNVTALDSHNCARRPRHLTTSFSKYVIAPAMVFTGIVEEMGEVLSIENLTSADGGVTMQVAAKTTVGGVSLGDSISVNGTCLTVTQLEPETFTFGLAPETLRRTNLGVLSVGSPVNLERSLAADGRFGGHVVQGHVDTTGKIVSLTRDKEAIVFEVELEPGMMKYIVEKGYITVDGASLTVIDVTATTFTFMMIAYTQAHVVTALKKVGDVVNIEVDITGKYIEKIMAARSST